MILIWLLLAFVLILLADMGIACLRDRDWLGVCFYASAVIFWIWYIGMFC